MGNNHKTVSPETTGVSEQKDSRFSNQVFKVGKRENWQWCLYRIAALFVIFCSFPEIAGCKANTEI